MDWIVGVSPATLRRRVMSIHEHYSGFSALRARGFAAFRAEGLRYRQADFSGREVKPREESIKGLAGKTSLTARRRAERLSSINVIDACNIPQ